MTQAPFEVVTTPSSPKMRSKVNILMAVLVVIFLVAAVVLGVILIKQRQEIREKAFIPRCPQDEECPVAKDPSHLRSCDQVEADGTPDEMLCSGVRVRTTARCGGKTFCCPAAGAAWTLNLSKCPSLTPTPTPTSTATPTPTPTRTPTPTPMQKIGDVNADGRVNIVDIGIIIDNYGQIPPPNPKADLNGDGVANMVDIGIIIDHYEI